MAITIEINTTTNVSLQIGDSVFFTNTTGVGSQQVASNPQLVGKITSMNENSITVDNEQSVPSAGSFLMFRKNRIVNNTSLLGYYAEVKLSNNSEDKAELFTLSSEIVPSSK